MNSPAFCLVEPRLCEMHRYKGVLPQREDPHYHDLHLAFEQRAQPIDLLGVCILAERTVGLPVSAERGVVAVMLTKGEMKEPRSRGTSKTRSGLQQDAALI